VMIYHRGASLSEQHTDLLICPPKPTSEASLTRDSSCVDLKTCSDVQYEVRDGVHGVSYHSSPMMRVRAGHQ